MKKSSLCVLGALCVSLNAAAGISSTDAVTAIVGEAAGQPYAVKLGIAEAIRNRGHLRGVYGLHAAHNATEPPSVWRDARTAWAQSVKSHLVAGANHFGNADDVRKGTFTGMTLTAVIGTGRHTTYFFKA